ncbi:hypothetical protein PV08_04385 [Exophiala spinifera]|uniref:Uncharacterized protein n=1 Tax=Exophiala spinifera TaxID=91928 RepID=A0A0D2C0K7_9EURO|nr:uncharacterized protein PV08_04385 [Exophiala spinifera]KIW17194.1 hypothetical protein PV08_04385 [Exophiala spinifera]
MPLSKLRYRIERSRIAKAKAHLPRGSSRLRRDGGGVNHSLDLPPNLANTIHGKAAAMDIGGEEPENDGHDGAKGHGNDDSSSDEEDGSSGDDDDGMSDDEENPFAEGLPSGSRTMESSSTNTADNPFLPKTSTTASNVSTSMPTSTAPAGSVGTGPTAPVNAPVVSGTSSSSTDIAAATGTSAASTSNNQPTVDTSVHHPANHTALIVVASIVGVFAIATGVYLLCRYCKPVRDRIAALRARRVQRLHDHEKGPSPGMSQVSTGMTARPRQQALASTPNLFSEKSENPFSDQVHLANSDVSRNGPTLRQVSIASIKRPPTWSSSDTDTTYPADTILKEYGAAPSTPATPLPAVPKLHPTGLANNPPTPVRGRRAPPPPPVLQQPIPRPFASDLIAGLNIRESVSSPTPSDFSVPGPPDSVVSVPRPYSQYQPRIRKSITPSESASNGPFSPLPMPALPAAFDSRWSRNSSSINGRATQLTQDTASRRASGGDRTANALPPPLPLAVKRSSAGSVASSIRSSGDDASVKDMTR